MSKNRSFVGLLAVVSLAGFAGATVQVVQGPSAPGYGTTLNFDEPGQATGLLPRTYWQGSHGVVIDGGDSQQVVDDHSAIFPWINSGNSFFGNFGVFLTFDNDLDGFSSRVWDPSGAPSPFGGGFGVFVFDDGVEVGSYFGTPAWGGLGDEWINVTATGGMKFDEVRILGFGFGPTTLVDDLSWNVVPAPASVGLLGLAAIGGMRRRR